MTQVQHIAYQGPRSFSWKAASYLVVLQLIVLHEVIFSQVQNVVFSFIELLEIPVRPFLQYVDVLLNSRPIFECIYVSYVVICKHVENVLYPH